MKHTISAQYKNVLLRPLRLGDIEHLREWRNNSENSKYLRQIGTITSEMQLKWFERDNVDADSYTFAIEETENLFRLTGSVGLYGFTESQVKSGRILIGDKEARGIALIAGKLALHIAFSHFGKDTVITETNTKNVAAIMLNRSLGYTFGDQRPFCDNSFEYELSITRERFYELHPEMLTVVIYNHYEE